jgi:very-long-chain ceramide synthase
MDYLLKPFAVWGGIKTNKGRIRFAEQGWILICYSISWTIGMVIPDILQHSATTDHTL